jgi:hypothetical protein
MRCEYKASSWAMITDLKEANPQIGLPERKVKGRTSIKGAIFEVDYQKWVPNVRLIYVSLVSQFSKTPLKTPFSQFIGTQPKP